MMPLSARSVCQLLVPVVLGLSPLAASAASDVTHPARRMGHPCRSMPTTSTASTPASATRWRRTGCSRWRCPAARCSAPSRRCSAPSMSPTTPRPAPTSTKRDRRPDPGTAPGAARHPARLRGRLQQAAGRGHGGQGLASAARIRRVRLRADRMDRLRRGDDLRGHDGEPLLPLFQRA